MPYQVEIAYSVANELLVSFLTYTCKTTLRRSDREKSWNKMIENLLEPDFADQLKHDEFVPKMSKLGYIYLLTKACPTSSDAKAFIDWLANLSPGDMYELLSPYMNQFKEDLALVRDKFVYYLTGWNESYFSQIDQGILTRLQNEAERQQARMMRSSDLPAFVEEVTNGLYFEEQENLKTLILSPQFHASPINWLYAGPFKNATICLYAFDAENEDNSEEPSYTLREGFRALSDVNRLKIVRLLRKEAKTYIELVRHLGIAKSTAYEHTLILRSAGLIRSHVVGDTAVSYSLRREGIARLNEELTDWIE